MTDKIERLVESTYRELSPSPAVEEELRENLSAEQKRPRRSPLVPMAAVLLVGVAFAIGNFRDGDKEEVGITLGGPVHRLAIATVARPPKGVVPKGKSEFHVRLLYGSRIQVLVGKEWPEVNLDELATHLRHAKDDTWVVVTVDRNAPWQHVQWIMTVCAQERLPKLAFVVKEARGGEFRLDASLPTDLGVAGRKDIRVRVRVKPVDMRKARWGVHTVRMPGAVRYSFGDREVDELASVARWLGDAKAAGRADGALVRGEVGAMARAPFESVMKVLAEFRHAGYAQVDFSGTGIPDAKVRAAHVLPYPGGVLVEPQRHTLTFEIVDGDPKELADAQAVVERRLTRAGFENFQVTRSAKGLQVTLPEKADRATVQKLVERKGATLVFHITVEPTAAGYAKEWERLKQVGEASKGLRWYPLSERGKATFAKSRLPEGKHPYVLCKLDDCNISSASIQNVSYRRSTHHLGEDWLIVFDVRKEHQANMQRLTRERGEYLAIILDGKVHSAPVLKSEVSNSAQISGGFSESDARSLATLLGSEALPLKLKRTDADVR